MLAVESIDAAGEVDICMCRLVDIGELGEWCRFCVM